MKTPTIIDAISAVLQESKTPLSIGVIYNNNSPLIIMLIFCISEK